MTSMQYVGDKKVTLNHLVDIHCNMPQYLYMYIYLKKIYIYIYIYIPIPETILLVLLKVSIGAIVG